MDSKLIITFKEELSGEAEPVGQVYLIDAEARAADEVYNQSVLGVPFGYEPAWQKDLGWLSRSDAEQAAREHGAAFEEV